MSCPDSMDVVPAARNGSLACDSKFSRYLLILLGIVG